MNGIIKLLPEHVANQIAAGEVVQRPASVVKELLENAVDAGARKIILRIEQAGKNLIEVVDDGCGMNPTDARLCFERHATSKISSAEDLFRLKTMGFRGEALASIASVSHVELLTRPSSEELGSRLVLEGGKVVISESVVCPAGTCLRVKNLFFNVPARRQFLKEDPTELNHIVNEFERVALSHPHIKMELISNGNIIHSLHPGNFIQRITALFGSHLKKNLVFFEEKTNLVYVRGYASSPQSVLKKKKEQFFFVNGRYIRSPYLSTAVYDAYRGLIQEGTHPQFFITLEVDPSTVDVNIHPTKTEVKFRYEREMYVILQSAIKRSLGKNVLRPELDFQSPGYLQEIYSITSSSGSGPKTPLPENSGFISRFSTNAPSPQKNENLTDWKVLHSILEKEQTPDLSSETPFGNTLSLQHNYVESELNDIKVVANLFQKYLLLENSSGFYLADRQRMHEVVLFEKAGKSWKSEKQIPVQQLLIPEEWELSKKDILFVKEHRDYFLRLGFDVQDFGKESMIIQGIPSGYSIASATASMEELLEQIKIQQMDDSNDSHPELAWCKSFAKTFCLKPGESCSEEELQFLVQSWTKSENPWFSPWGKPVLHPLEPEVIDQWFKKQKT